MWFYYKLYAHVTITREHNYNVPLEIASLHLTEYSYMGHGIQISDTLTLWHVCRKTAYKNVGVFLCIWHCYVDWFPGRVTEYHAVWQLWVRVIQTACTVEFYFPELAAISSDESIKLNFMPNCLRLVEMCLEHVNRL